MKKTKMKKAAPKKKGATPQKKIAKKTNPQQAKKVAKVAVLKALPKKTGALTPEKRKEFLNKLKAAAKNKAAEGRREPPKRITPRPTAAELKKRHSITAYLALGSNVGDREEFIEQAITLLAQTLGIKVVKRSTNIETEPEGKTNQPPFINAAVEISTTLKPHELLDMCREIEHTLGREREVEWGPRPIDLDILLYGDQVVSEEDLTIPHPLMHERLFVLAPLKEIAPHAHHPVLEREVHELFDEKKMEAGEKYDDDLPGFKEIKRGVYDDFERW